MFEGKAFNHGGKAVAEIMCKSIDMRIKVWEVIERESSTFSVATAGAVLKELRELEFLLKGLEGELDK